MRRLALVTLASLALAAAGTVRADMFTYDLTQNPNGDKALGNTIATIADVAPGTVRITLSAGLPSNQNVDTWLFNFNGNLNALSSLVFTSVSGPKASTATSVNGYGSNQGYGGQAGLFDIKFTFTSTGSNKDSYFDGGETAVYDVTSSTLGTSLTASLFNVTSTNAKANSDGYYTAVHIKSIPNASSGVMASDTSIHGIPEPASVAMALTSSLCLGLVALRCRGRTA